MSPAQTCSGDTVLYSGEAVFSPSGTLSLMPAVVSAVVASGVRVAALFSLVNMAIDAVFFGARGAWLWVGLHGCPHHLAAAWLGAFGVGVLAWSRLPGGAAITVRVLVASAAVLCAVDVARFYALLVGDDIVTGWPLPISLIAALALGYWAWRPPERGRPFRWPAAFGALALDALVAAVCLFVLCLTFGQTDYRRPADAIVVFGAAVRGDGSPSLSLHDRTRTACLLYRDGAAPYLVFSGGQGEGVPVSEPEAMRALAHSMGVPDAAIVLDDAGLNTLATVRNAAAMARDRGWSSLLMVSHDFHLARIKMFTRRAGLRAFTVPAEETRRLGRKPYLYCREMAAIATYFLPGLWD